MVEHADVTDYVDPSQSLGLLITLAFGAWRVGRGPSQPERLCLLALAFVGHIRLISVSGRVMLFVMV